MINNNIKTYLQNVASKLPLQEQLPKLTNETNLSIVVPAYNEKNYIGQLLTHLNQQVISANFEIIIVDNGSNDNTASIVKKFDNNHPTYLINEPKSGAGNARKSGVDEVIRRVYERDFKTGLRKHYIAFTDADTKPDNLWLSDMYSLLCSTSDSSLISGNYEASQEVNEVVNKKIGINNFFRSFSLLSSELDKIVGQTRMRGPNSGLEIECYIKAGGFRQPVDKNGNTAPRECFDLAHRIALQGTPILHFDHTIIASQRRKLQEIISGISSYEKIDTNTKRFISNQEPEEVILKKALDVPLEAWITYRDKTYSKIATNSLLTPIYNNKNIKIKNVEYINNWGDLLADTTSLSFSDFCDKWAKVIVKDTLSKLKL